MRLFPSGVLRIPHRRVTTLTVAAWWIVQPIIVERYYSQQLWRGAYRPDADSIGIPIGTDWAFWLLSSPLVLLFVWWAVRRYQNGASYVALPRGARGYLATIITLLAIIITSALAWADLDDGYPLLAAAQIPGIVSLLWLRAGNAHTRPAPRGLTIAEAAKAPLL